MGVCEDFQPPPGSGTWLWAACLTPQDLAPRLWIIFCYGDSKYPFVHVRGIRVCPSLHVSAPAWEGERKTFLLPSQHVFPRGRVVPMSSLVCNIILICITTNLLQSIRRVVLLYTDMCYEHIVDFMTTPLDLLTLQLWVFSLHYLSLHLSF